MLKTTGKGADRSMYKENCSPDGVKEEVRCKGRQAGHLGLGQEVWVLKNDLHAAECNSCALRVPCAHPMLACLHTAVRKKNGTCLSPKTQNIGQASAYHAIVTAGTIGECQQLSKPYR